MADRSSPGVDNSEGVNRAGVIGAGAQISGNVHQEFHVTSGGGKDGRWYPVKDLLLPIIVGLVVAAVGGAWGKTKFDIATAPERTAAYSQNLVTLSNEALKLYMAQPTSPDLTAKLQEIASQARAVEAAAAFLGIALSWARNVLISGFVLEAVEYVLANPPPSVFVASIQTVTLR